MKTINKIIKTIIPSFLLAVLLIIGTNPVNAQQDKTTKQEPMDQGKSKSSTEKEMNKSQSQREMMQTTAGMHSKEDVNKMIQSWPSESQEIAKKMITKYGQPSEVSQSMLMWKNNGPWKATFVFKETVDHNFPMKHKDVLEQVIDYKVPAELFSQLASYDGSVVAKRTCGEISSRNDREETNFLALNIANDIITGRKNVEEARQFYTETMTALSEGQKPDYTQKFMFAVAKGNTADPDQPTMNIIDKMKNMMKGSE